MGDGSVMSCPQPPAPWLCLGKLLRNCLVSVWSLTSPMALTECLARFSGVCDLVEGGGAGVGRAQEEQEPGLLLSPRSCRVDMLDKPKVIRHDLSVLRMALEMLARAPFTLMTLRQSRVSRGVLGSEARSPLPSLTGLCASP